MIRRRNRIIVCFQFSLIICIVSQGLSTDEPTKYVTKSTTTPVPKCNIKAELGEPRDRASSNATFTLDLIYDDDNDQQSDIKMHLNTASIKCEKLDRLKGIRVTPPKTKWDIDWFVHTFKILKNSNLQKSIMSDSWIEKDVENFALRNKGVTWEANILTGNRSERFGETLANIWLKLYGGGQFNSRGISVKATVHNGERHFTFHTVDVGDLSAIKIWHDGKNGFPEWNLEQVKLRRSDRSIDYLANCDCWITTDGMIRQGIFLGRSPKLDAILEIEIPKVTIEANQITTTVEAITEKEPTDANTPPWKFFVNYVGWIVCAIVILMFVVLIMIGKKRKKRKKKGDITLDPIVNRAQGDDARLDTCIENNIPATPKLSENTFPTATNGVQIHVRHEQSNGNRDNLAVGKNAIATFIDEDDQKMYVEPDQIVDAQEFQNQIVSEQITAPQWKNRPGPSNEPLYLELVKDLQSELAGSRNRLSDPVDEDLYGIASPKLSATGTFANALTPGANSPIYENILHLNNGPAYPDISEADAIYENHHFPSYDKKGK
ncbi:uncharacterized protein LOC141900407 [Tubulanus polymorphus]|uniref:uncharacterized protein LOC141900407 n=1 Tax=Tubulanus polymorphus TaxID=672921 RepID=UPI003DA550AD